MGIQVSTLGEFSTISLLLFDAARVSHIRTNEQYAAFLLVPQSCQTSIQVLTICSSRGTGSTSL